MIYILVYFFQKFDTKCSSPDIRKQKMLYTNACAKHVHVCYVTKILFSHRCLIHTFCTTKKRDIKITNCICGENQINLLNAKNEIKLWQGSWKW